MVARISGFAGIAFVLLTFTATSLVVVSEFGLALFPSEDEYLREIQSRAWRGGDVKVYRYVHGLASNDFLIRWERGSERVRIASYEGDRGPEIRLIGEGLEIAWRERFQEKKIAVESPDEFRALTEPPDP